MESFWEVFWRRSTACPENGRRAFLAKKKRDIKEIKIDKTDNKRIVYDAKQHRSKIQARSR